MKCQECGKEFESIRSMTCTFDPATNKITGAWCDALCKNGLVSRQGWRVRYSISKRVFQGYLEVFFTYSPFTPQEVLAAICPDGRPEGFEGHEKRILSADFTIEEVRLIERRTK